ncbi:hypothetical protein UFOVP1043_29 [uncultured Caudovirales phage]|uniref:Uncharacterized protein n=1 Tax=uncultured Caudovirales phage TaxID=2100421 RepID=A0A6J5QGU0_9CAUD|nr:hypothetical protein UFOVP1043_29 [uncultured Caudovirales phage]
MAAPVTNQNYTQQINQAFDMLKYATPQQMQVVSQQVQQNPNSPEAMALAMAAQYQQQARAPRPQAPQGTILQQKLGEFTQTSPQGLPQINQNQMAMQQAAQKNPMFGAGLAVAPENTEQAPAPQQMAATGGITALAHGGEVRGFEVGGDAALDPLSNVDPNAQPEDSFYNNIAEYGKKGLIGGLKNVGRQYKQGFNNLYEDVKDLGTDVLYGSEGPPKESLPTPVPEIKVKDKDKDKDTTAPKGIVSLKEHLSKGEVNPSSYDADAAVASMLNSQTTPKYSEAPIGKDDILFAPADTSSAARNQASPTAYQTLEDIMKFRGEEADMSEEVGMAKEYAANASRDKGLGALVGGIGGMLSAQTPNMGQAVGAGLMSGLSSYQSGAKDEQAANKDLMALQMASKKSKLQGHREAADIILAKQTAIDAARASTYNKMQEEQYKQGLTHKNAVDIKDMEFNNAREQTILKSLLEAHPTAHQDETLYMKAVDIIKTNNLFEKLTDAEIMEKAQAYVDSAKRQQEKGGLGNIGGQPSGQAIGSRGISLVGQ